MHLSILSISATIFTYVVFGYLGYRISKKFKRPVSLARWLLLVFATFTVSFFGRNAILIGGGEFIIRFNEAFQAIGVGIIIGLATREIRIKVTSNEASQQHE